MLSSRLSSWLNAKGWVVPGVTALLRVAVGLVFLFSGLAKSLDLWGTAYKIQEYLQAWGMADQVTWPMVKTAAAALSWGEFVAGALLLLGCYRRTVAWLLTAVMAFMLPLSLYLWVADPVADCGCFGDALVISNRATFWKNMALMAGLVWLCRFNSRVVPWFNPYSQWMVGALLSGYIFYIGFAGFGTQPLVDFRRFPMGTDLSAVGRDDTGSEEEAEFRFIYERAGVRRAFTADSLPDEAQGWVFVDRELTSGSDAAPTDAFVVTNADGEDVTDQAIHTDGRQILVAVPDLSKVNPGQTYYINELSRAMQARGGSLSVLIGSDSQGVAFWRDIAMPDYDVYTAEPTLLKELVRGNPGVVGLQNGRVVWKSTLSAISDSGIDPGRQDPFPAIEELTGRPNALRNATGILVVLLGVLYILDRLGITIHRRLFRKPGAGKKKKCVE